METACTVGVSCGGGKGVAAFGQITCRGETSFAGVRRRGGAEQRVVINNSPWRRLAIFHSMWVVRH